MWVWGSSLGGKNGAISKKGNFLWNRKITCEEASQNLLKFCLSFGGGLDSSNEKNGEATERRGFIVKCGEMLFEGSLWKSCGSLHMWRSYEHCLYQKVSSSWEVKLARIGLHTGCKGVSGYCYHCWILGATITGCVDLCLKKRRVGSGVKQVLIICLEKVTRWKFGDGGVGSCCWTVVVGW